MVRGTLAVYSLQFTVYRFVRKVVCIRHRVKDEEMLNIPQTLRRAFDIGLRKMKYFLNTAPAISSTREKVTFFEFGLRI